VLHGGMGCEDYGGYLVMHACYCVRRLPRNAHGDLLCVIYDSIPFEDAFCS